MIDSDFLLSEDDANDLAVEHKTWAEAIARSVARAWSLDWRLDGLDGAALEALIFCARRFNPRRGVPFRGYSRRRIHEAATEQARKSRGWRKGYTSNNDDRVSREISAELFHIFPELRAGQLPPVEVSAAVYKGDRRSAIRQVLVGAALLAAHHNQSSLDREELLDFKTTVSIIATLDSIHQCILYSVYWEGKSLRQIAAEWEIEGLTVIREHKVLLEYLAKRLTGVSGRLLSPKVRPSLREVYAKHFGDEVVGPFSQLISSLDPTKQEQSTHPEEPKSG